jgi:hypothetical protein
LLGYLAQVSFDDITLPPPYPAWLNPVQR